MNIVQGKAGNAGSAGGGSGASSVAATGGTWFAVRGRLREYQRSAVETTTRLVLGRTNTLLVAPTGSGKTHMFAAVVQAATAEGYRTLVVAHRRELLDQAHEKLERVGVESSIYRGGDGAFSPCDVVLASIQCGEPEGFTPDLIVVDEAHHAPAESYRALIARHPAAVVLGATATPWWRTSTPLTDIFPATVVAASVRELTDLGYLARVRMFTHPRTLQELDLRGVKMAEGDFARAALSDRVCRGTLLGDMVEHWKSHAGGARTLAFAASVEHSRLIASRFNAAGVPAEHLDGNTTAAERAAILGRLVSGETVVVSSYDVLSEGFDAPTVGCVILGRPTKNLRVYRQCVGRGMRRDEEREDVVVLDHAGSCLAFGLPDTEFEALGEPETPGSGEPPVRLCPSCGLCVPLAVRVCPECSARLRKDVPTEAPTGVLVEVLCGAKRSNITLTLGGVTRTFAEWAEELGVPEMTLRSRDAAGLPPEQVLAPLKVKRLLLTWGGRTQNIPAWSKETGLAEETIRQRIVRLGWTDAQALGKEPRSSSARTYEYRGRQLTTVELAAATGMKEETIRTRLKRGFSVEDACKRVMYVPGVRRKGTGPQERPTKA